MLRRSTLFAAMAGLALFFGAHAAARAETGRDAAEIAALRNARTSLVQAIAVAERTAGGKAIDAGLDNENGVMSYSVEILKDSAIETVLVDLGTGEVRKITPADAEPRENSESKDQENDD